MVLSKSPVVVVFVSFSYSLEIIECLLTTEAQLRGAAARVCAGASGLAGKAGKPGRLGWPDQRLLPELPYCPLQYRLGHGILAFWALEYYIELK